MKRVYLDYAAAAPMDPRVKREILKYIDVFGNASSIHASGREAKEIINKSKERIGRVLHCRPEELVMTGSGTEANNLAIFGILPQDGHIISTNIEHHSVLRPLQKRGNVTFVPVKPNGIVDPKDIAKAIRPDTVLVSVIYANNEIGTIQPIKEIAKKIENWKLEIHGKPPAFHVDSCQAAGYLNINVQELGVDLMTINGSKIYGPKGVGALFVRRGTKLAPQILGGDQERGFRAGTQNPALIAGFVKALEIANSMREKESARLEKLRDWFISQIPEVKLNGDPILRLPNNINISFDNIDGEMLMFRLDLHGIEVSTGAACTVSSNEPSHVLKAIVALPVTPSHPSPYNKGKVQEGVSAGNIRITLGRSTTKKDIEKTLEILKREVNRQRFNRK